MAVDYYEDLIKKKLYELNTNLIVRIKVKRYELNAKLMVRI